MREGFEKMKLLELSELLSKKELSSEELTRAFLCEIEKKDGEINAFISVDFDGAIAAAKRTDQRRLMGETLSPLAGIPFGAKDNICSAGLRTTCGSRMLESYISPYDATVIERLKGRGCVLLGKLNMDEFAMGSATDTSVFGATHNPLSLSRTVGGSSGGSAAAVAAGMLPFALGSDTGGSVRKPAAFCGVVGMKPTYGAVSRYGLVAFASSLEQIGPISADVRSNALVFAAIAGRDERDATTQRELIDPTNELGRGVKGLRIGISLKALDMVSSDVRAAVERAIHTLQSLGAEIVEVTLPDFDPILAAYYVISSAEASSNLARFDGVRYGFSCKSAEGIDELYTKSRGKGFGTEVKRRIILGTFALSRDGREEVYGRALAVRRHTVGLFDEMFERCDALLLPVAPKVADKLSDRNKTPLETYREDSLSVLANMAGIPALSLPCGYGEEGMPVGLQLMGKAFSEAMLYRIGLLLEKELGGKGGEE